MADEGQPSGGVGAGAGQPSGGVGAGAGQTSGGVGAGAGQPSGDAGAGAGQPRGGGGVPDAFERLWTPHRMAYLKGEGKPAEETGCPLCAMPGKSDDDGLVVARGVQVYAVLNLYPYNPGHLMVVPYRHVADLTELSDAETTELAAYTRAAVTTLREVSHPQGFNVGMNLGAVAGAGIAEHVHQHVVPRWGGDTNFMPVVGRTKVLPQLLADTRDLLAAAWPVDRFSAGRPPAG